MKLKILASAALVAACSVKVHTDGGNGTPASTGGKNSSGGRSSSGGAGGTKSMAGTAGTELAAGADQGGEAGASVGGAVGHGGASGHAGAKQQAEAGTSTSAGEGGESGNGTAGEAGAGSGGIDLTLLGCRAESGARPPSTGTTAAPQVTGLTLEVGARKQPLSGSITFSDAQGDETDLIVQVNGSDSYYVCPLTTSDLTNGKADLGQLSPGPNFPSGSELVYFGVRDKPGNVSAYVVGTLSVGRAGAIATCNGNGDFQLMGKVPSESTSFYQQVNGYSPDYRLSSATGTELTVVGATRVLLDMGSCGHLRLSGDEEATKPLGWDNCLVIEYRQHSGGDPDKAWFYCSYDAPTVYSLITDAPLTTPAAPTVAGTALDPQVPNGSPFGYPPLALDLMSEIPSDATTFELTLYVLDYGVVGSTTDIWARASAE